MNYLKVLLRKYTNRKDGSLPLYIRITINRKQKYYSLRNFIHPDHWDEKKERVRRSHQDHEKINAIIEKETAKAKQIFFKHTLEDKRLNFTDFERDFNQSINNKDSFYEYVCRIMNVSKHYSKETIRSYKSYISKLKQFRPELNFNEIDKDFLREYQSYMIEVLKNSENTYNTSFAFIKNIINKAVSDGLIKESNLKGFKIKRKEGNREFLTIEELNILKEIYKTGSLKAFQKNVLKYFLFACNTGLRYTDIKNLKYCNLDNDFIKLIMHKTKELVEIPINDYAKSLINPVFEVPNERVFKVNSNQKTNSYLKEIIRAAGINKEISFHCARHTFATINISLGVNLDVVSKLLGHTNIKTTSIYAKYSREVKREVMNKWNEI